MRPPYSFFCSFEVWCSKFVYILFSNLCKRKEWNNKCTIKIYIKVGSYSHEFIIEEMEVSPGRCLGSMMRNYWWKRAMPPIYSIVANFSSPHLFFFSHLVLHLSSSIRMDLSPTNALLIAAFSFIVLEVVISNPVYVSPYLSLLSKFRFRLLMNIFDWPGLKFNL